MMLLYPLICPFFGFLKPFLVNMYESIPYGLTHLFKNIVDICVKLILVAEIAHSSLKNRPVMITTLIPALDLGSGPKMSFATDSKGPSAGKCWSMQLERARASAVRHLRSMLVAWAIFEHRSGRIIPHGRSVKVLSHPVKYTSLLWCPVVVE